MFNSDKVNFHTHTMRCRHADGIADMYCAEAENKNLVLLGISDHAPFPDNRFSGSRMDFSELPDYRAEIESAKGKYSSMKILAGLEAEISDPFGPDFLQDVYLEQFHFDYLIGAVHSVGDDPSEVLWGGAPPFSAATVRKFIEAEIRLIAAGKFLYLAHPDIWAMKVERWTPEIALLSKELFSAARDADIPLEINAYGMRKPEINTPEGIRRQYPWRPFWELAAEFGGIRVVIGADAHTPHDVWSNAPDAFNFAESMGFQPVNGTLAKRFL